MPFFAEYHARAERQAFFFAHFGIAAFVDTAAVRLFGEQFVNGVAVDFRAGGKDFYRVDVGVLVDDASGDAVVFRIDEAEGARLVLDVETAALACSDGAVEQVAEEFTVDVALLAERPEAPAYLGLGRIRRKTQKVALETVNLDGIAERGVADDFVDSPAEDPRVVTQCGLFASGLQGNRFHARKCRKRTLFFLDLRPRCLNPFLTSTPFSALFLLCFAWPSFLSFRP